MCVCVCDWRGCLILSINQILMEFGTFHIMKKKNEPDRRMKFLWGLNVTSLTTCTTSNFTVLQEWNWNILSCETHNFL